MEYQVWTKDETYEVWNKVECGDREAALREIEKAVRAGGEPILTVLIPYEFGISIKEVDSEAKKSKTKPGEGPGSEGDSQV